MDLSTIGAVLGTALMIGSPAAWVWWRWQVARHWTLVDGVVVRVETVPGTAGAEGGLANPVIRVRRPDGETVQFRSPYSADPSPWSAGDTVTVRVRGDVVRHDSPGAALLGYGAVFAVGVFVFVKSRGG